MYQAPVYQTSPYSNSYVPRYSEYDSPLTQSYHQVSRIEDRNLPSTYQAPPSSSAQIFYDLSAHESEDDAPSRSSYSVRSLPVASTYRYSSPTRRSPAIKEWDVSTEINIASLVLAGIVGATSISLQAKGNYIAAASYRLALASRDATVRGAQSVGLGAAAAGGRVGGAMGGGAVTLANAMGSAASGIVHTGSNCVASDVPAFGRAASGIT
ncbi:hypothetical protein B0O99DRAFT_692368 [Bisporella sp. PMI_857]|nr:hypothetical protein B0O99DRAFT_692368 [Bisporella sp. PMI_857]